MSVDLYKDDNALNLDRIQVDSDTNSFLRENSD